MTFGKIGARKMMNTAWINPYVKDGLVAMWDGIWNVGGGLPHDSNSQVWLDCIAGRPILFPCSNTYFTTDGLVKDSTPNASGSVIGVSVGSETNFGWTSCEFVITVSSFTGTASPIIMDIGNRKMWLQQATSGIGALNVGKPWTFPSIDFSTLPVKFSFSAIYGGESSSDFNSQLIYANGNDNGTQDGNRDTWGNISVKTNMMANMYNGVVAYPFYGTYHAIRLYNKTLTSAEVAANHAVDRERFGLI